MAELKATAMEEQESATCNEALSDTARKKQAKWLKREEKQYYFACQIVCCQTITIAKVDEMY